MCGISGIFSIEALSEEQFSRLTLSVAKLQKRGPDAEGKFKFNRAALGHRRLSIIDTSEASNQPFFDESKRYCMVFNGEIYNYQTLRQELITEGVSFRTEGDTEVLLKAYLRYGTSFLNKLDGFFALAIYDNHAEEWLIARDRFGIKPLLFYNSERFFAFASEMKALLEFDIPREIDQNSLYKYLQLNYIPEPHSIIKDIKKLEPGHYLKIDAQKRLQSIPFYQLEYDPASPEYSDISYEDAQQELIALLDQSVRNRLVADVGVGTFLSGGIDSSLITALASRHHDKIKTFSVGFTHNKQFDESEHALLLAKKYKTDHHRFMLGEEQLLASLYECLDYIDEPFADSSALAVRALSNETSRHVKVALSGDGADELFAGYNKHRGEYLMRKENIKTALTKNLSFLWQALPKSRHTKLGNLFRKLHKFSEGSALSIPDRYWLWAGLLNEAEAANLMLNKADGEVYARRKHNLIHPLLQSDDFNNILLTDLQMVLCGDMLRKVDLMSMSCGLEVRTPFLDHKVVDFAFKIPSSYKISEFSTKRILRDAARDFLPEELYNKPKQGFEVPLWSWLNNELKELVFDDLLSTDFLQEQNLFNISYVNHLKQKLQSKNPADVQANVWALVVFNHWWKRYIG